MWHKHINKVSLYGHNWKKWKSSFTFISMGKLGLDWPVLNCARWSESHSWTTGTCREQVQNASRFVWRPSHQLGVREEGVHFPLWYWALFLQCPNVCILKFCTKTLSNVNVSCNTVRWASLGGGVWLWGITLNISVASAPRALASAPTTTGLCFLGGR